ncbi:microtubule organization protein AKNA isoform X3 [Sciurus carolinensis]|uniref:microtubule organization protein AKNA isoform X3 n=1 Tax=Sciurus carolinensis TaxID=30640 RepID=UPI001FB55C18|nr:microtubule organization protein AKNA isoform X3 [Sciurus carolinensis]
MASSGTEVRWAGPGLGKGPQQRRRWAWAEEEAAERRNAHGWGDGQPFPGGASPELLEDFRLAQQHLLPLAWAPGPQASGASSGEEVEAEDVDSPESSTLPLNWLAQQDHQLDMTEEEPDETPGSPEAEDPGESSPRPGQEAALHPEHSGNTCPMALGRSQVRGWVASGEQASGSKLPEHSEVNPSVELGSTRSWSSGTMSMSRSSDSLDSTWEGEADVPQPAALAEALPQSPHHHLNPDDRTGGSVAPATPTEFQDPSAPPAQSPQNAAGRWKRETTSLPLPADQAWKQTKTSPRPLPCRFTGSISPPNPRPRPARKDRSLPSHGATLANHSSSDAPKYGRGRLNYPLPDFSKVGPRVRFPKDESYRPPKSRSHNKQPQGPARPLIFKSPAEIVREVLLSSGEASLAKDPPPAHPVTRVPQEFQTPEQATELVHQLQEDYHKLLTKYAEAENTIDQLRLGAKVNLYSDPPQPSHSIHMGAMPPGTKALSFTIPQPRSVECWPGPTQKPQASEAAGWSSARGDLSPSSPPSVPAPGWLPENQGVTRDQSSPEWTQALASQASRFLAKVESFEGLVQAGQLSPQDQLKGFQQLKATHAALEEEYLRACREPHLAPHPASSKGVAGKFDPARELEVEIYHLGTRLEELKGHMEQTQRGPELAGSDSALDRSPITHFPHTPAHPAASGQVSTPAFRTPYPEHWPQEHRGRRVGAVLHSAPTFLAQPTASTCLLHTNVEASLGSSELEDRPPGLPAPLKHKELQVEQDFHGLLERYLSVKSLPEALRVEEERERDEEEQEEEEEHHGTLEVDGPAAAPGRAKATRALPRHLVRVEKSHRAPLQDAGEQMVPVKPPSFQTSTTRDGHTLSPGRASGAPPGPGVPPDRAYHQSSLTSLEGSGISEHLPQKSLRLAGRPHAEEPWMASPETDSGFVGSETSRVSPLTQTPEHRLSHSSNPGAAARHFTASAPCDGSSHPKTRGPLVPRRTSEPSTPRSRAQRHPSSQSCPLRQRKPSSHLDQELAAEMVDPGPEFEGRKQISEQLFPSSTISLPPTPAPAAAPLPGGSRETTPSLLLSRTGRDQAILELQAEVSRLRLQLEDSLHRPLQGSPTHPTSACDQPALTQDRPAASSTPWGSHCGSKSIERLSGESEGTEQPAGRQRARSSSVPREVPQLSLSLDSEPPSPQVSTGKNRNTEDGPWASQEETRRAGSGRRPDRVSFRGQYTGQEYHLLPSKAALRNSGTASCPRCQPIRSRDTGSAATREPQGPSATDALRCPLCGHIKSLPEGDGPGSGTPGGLPRSARGHAHPRRNMPGGRRVLAPPTGAEKSSAKRNAPTTSSPKQRSQRAGSPARPPPGLWYLAAAPSARRPPAFAYVPSVPVMPYPPATVYYAPTAPTSAPTASPRPARGHRHSIQLDPEDLEELHAALNQAVQAAEDVRSTTRRMTRSLSADLRQARSPRGACLF